MAQTFLSTLLLFFLCNFVIANDLEEQKIQFLLEKIENFEGTFIRNGQEHESKRAREHLEYKLRQAQRTFWFFGPKKPVSAQVFIEKIASESSMTGKIYQIKYKDGKIFPAEHWLKKKLKEFKKKSTD